MATLTCILVSHEETILNRFENLLQFVDDISLISKENVLKTAITNIVRLNPDLIFIDTEMPGINCFDFIRELNLSKCNSTIIIVSNLNQNAIKAIKIGAFDFLLKPIDLTELKETINRFKQLVLAQNRSQSNTKENRQSL